MLIEHKHAIAFTPDQYEWLKRQSHTSGLSVAFIVRRLIDDAMRDGVQFVVVKERALGAPLDRDAS
jgi:hypothetical protein